MLYDYYAFRMVKDKLIVPSIHDSKYIYLIRLNIIRINTSIGVYILMQIYLKYWNDEITSNQIMHVMGHTWMPKREEPITFVSKSEFLLRHNALPVMYRAKSFHRIVWINMVLFQSVLIVYHYSQRWWVFIIWLLSF